MSVRLPNPGGDAGNWGTILNTFLDVAHNGDGTIQASAVQAAGAVTAVNSKSPVNGAVVLGAIDVGALATSQRGVANGVATLDNGGNVPLSQLGNAPTSTGSGGSGGGTTTTALGLALLSCPLQTSSSSTTAADGQLLASLVTATGSTTITTLGAAIQIAGVTPAAGVNKMALFSEAGAQLAITGDMTTTFSSVGFAEGALTASYQLTSGTNYYIVLLSSFSGTAPKVAGSTGNFATFPLNGHYVTLHSNASQFATMPSSFTPSSLITTSFFHLLYAR